MWSEKEDGRRGGKRDPVAVNDRDPIMLSRRPLSWVRARFERQRSDIVPDRLNVDISTVHRQRDSSCMGGWVSGRSCCVRSCLSMDGGSKLPQGPRPPVGVESCDNYGI